MRVLHVHNLMHRHYGKRNSYSGTKFSNGIIRANHNLYEFSDRDIVRFEAPLGIRPLGIKAMNQKLLETCYNFKPDFILLGHCDLVTARTLTEVRRLLPRVKIAHWFLDALWIKRNVYRLKSVMNQVDSIFVTTAGNALKQFCTGNNVVCFIPNPSDSSVENYDNSKKTEFEVDLLFCGVGKKSDERYSLLRYLDHGIGRQLNFKTYGIYGDSPIWGSAYQDLLGDVKMALNLNRAEGWKYYSSDRISQLMANGILTFMWDSGDMRELLGEENAVFFNSKEELLSFVISVHHNDEERVRIASAGRDHYIKYFNSEKIINYIIETTFGQPYSSEYLWSSESYK